MLKILDFYLNIINLEYTDFTGHGVFGYALHLNIDWAFFSH